MGFGNLRVINEDRVIPGAGFGTHSHRDMEIISYVLEGKLAHRDSMGTGSIIRPGDLQRMSAGTGVRHSEMNASDTEPVHFLQIWLLPESDGLAPSYEQKHFKVDDKQNQWRLIGSRDGREGSVTIHQDVRLYAATLDADAELVCGLDSGRRAWLQIVRGAVMVDGQILEAGDGAAVADLNAIMLTANEDNTEILLFDLAAT